MADSDWRNVEIETLPTNVQALYANAKAVYKEYKAAKEAFEEAMQQHFGTGLPANKELKFGYNFGKLSIAVGPKRERKAAKGESTQSLGDWLAAQTADGHNS